MFSGIALANLAGVPLGTWLGHELGWRATFLAISVLGVVMIAALATLIPHLPTLTGVRLRHEVAALGNPRVLLALFMTLLGFGGVFAALVVALFAFTFTAHQPVLAVINVFLLGALGMATVPPLQTLVLQRASAAPTLASAINIGAFNLGDAVAAWLAGFTISAGLGLESAGWVGALMTLAALMLAFVSVALMRREARGASTASVTTDDAERAESQLADATRG